MSQVRQHLLVGGACFLPPLACQLQHERRIAFLTLRLARAAAPLSLGPCRRPSVAPRWMRLLVRCALCVVRAPLGKVARSSRVRALQAAAPAIAPTPASRLRRRRSGRHYSGWRTPAGFSPSQRPLRAQTLVVHPLIVAT